MFSVLADETIRVSERAYTRLLELLENPPEPNARLRAAIADLPADI